MVVLQQSGGLERGESLATAGGVPNITIAAILMDALHDGLDRVYLVRARDEDLLLTLHKEHVAADQRENTKTKNPYEQLINHYNSSWKHT